MQKQRVMIIDDSVVARRIIAEAIRATEDIEVAASAANGKIGLAKLPRIKPDVVLLDIEMPEMDGLQTLAAIRNEYPSLPVIMFSALTGKGAKTTLEALALGANDYATKPTTTSQNDMQGQLNLELIPKIRALCKPKGTPPTIDIPPPPTRTRKLPRRERPPQAVVIGSSTGGPNALSQVIGDLPDTLSVPIFVVQHMPAVFTRQLAERLDKLNGLRVCEATDHQRVEPGHVYIAPGDYHMIIARRKADVIIRLNQEPPENSCRPAVDVLFRSAAEVYGGDTLAVVLTGMGRDGFVGCKQLYNAGAQIVCQDEASSVVWGMPGYVARANLADSVVPLSSVGEQIAARLTQEATEGPGGSPWS